jgi:hypothetical protein
MEEGNRQLLAAQESRQPVLAPSWKLQPRSQSPLNETTKSARLSGSILRAGSSIALARDRVHDSRLLHVKRQRGQDMSDVCMDL